MSLTEKLLFTKCDLQKTRWHHNGSQQPEKALALQVLFQFYSPAASSIAFGSDIRLFRVLFASRVEWANRIPLRHRRNITFAAGKNITPNEVRHITKSTKPNKLRFTKSRMHHNGSQQPKSNYPNIVIKGDAFGFLIFISD